MFTPTQEGLAVYFQDITSPKTGLRRGGGGGGGGGGPD